MSERRLIATGNCVDVIESRILDHVLAVPQVIEVGHRQSRKRVQRLTDLIELTQLILVPRPPLYPALVQDLVHAPALAPELQNRLCAERIRRNLLLSTANGHKIHIVEKNVRPIKDGNIQFLFGDWIPKDAR